MRKKSLFAFLLTLLLLTSFLTAAASPSDYDTANPENLAPDNLYSASCIVMDADTGVVLFEKDADTRRYPASITKIVTCILALEWAEENDMLDETITIPDGWTLGGDESKMGINIGDQLTMEHLLYGMMINSGNDAAYAVAIIVAGSQAGFVRQMNQFVEKLGLSTDTTHFSNPTGMHDSNHFTCARDMARIMAYCLKNDTFRQIISASDFEVEFANPYRRIKYTSEYDLIDPEKKLKGTYYEPCIGGKSGFTKKSGRSVISAAVQNDVTLVSVCFNPDDINYNKDYTQAYTDTIRLFKYGFLQYDVLKFKDLFYGIALPSSHCVSVEHPSDDDMQGGLLEWNVAGIPAEYVESYLKSDLENEETRDAIRKDFESRLSLTLTNGKVEAPVEQNEVIGIAEFVGKDGMIYSGYAVAARAVERRPDTAEEPLENWVDEALPRWFRYLLPRFS